MRFLDASLARRLEACKARAAREYACAQERLRPGSTATLPVAGGIAVFVGAASPISRAMGLGMEGPLTRFDLGEIEAFFRTREGSPRLELCPLAHPSLLDLAGERGYRIAHFRNVLVRSLETGEPLPEIHSDAVVVPAESPAQKRTWLYTVARGFLSKEDITPEETWISEPMTKVPAVRCYLAMVGSEVVGGGAMAVREGVAYLSSTGVRPAFRGRGAQSALLGQRLAEAMRAGCDLAMVETTPGSPSQRNLERFGFRVAYTAMAMVLD